jgi:signal transduction histidine kinase
MLPIVGKLLLATRQLCHKGADNLMAKMETDQYPQEQPLHPLSRLYREWSHHFVLNSPWWRSAPVGYLICALLMGIALLVSHLEQLFAVKSYISGAPFSLVTIVVALLWGVGPALFAIVLGFILLDSFVISPYGLFSFNGWGDAAMYGPYILGELIVIIIVAQRERSQRRVLAAELKVYKHEKAVASQALTQSNQQLEQFNRQVERENQLKDMYLSRAAHELKTPITTIRGQTQLALRRLAKSQQIAPEQISLQTLLEKIEEQTHRLHTLIDDLIAANSLSSRKVSLRITWCNLGHLCHEVVTDQQALSDHHIELELPSEPIMLQADCQRLTQVVGNLVTNAVKYSPENTTIGVCASQEFPDAIITVHNKGHPIPPEQQPYIFEPFYRTPEAAHSSIQGWGLGLWICKEIVELHKGQIWVESSEAKGTSFFVQLPLPVAYP